MASLRNGRLADCDTPRGPAGGVVGAAFARIMDSTGVLAIPVANPIRTIKYTVEFHQRQSAADVHPASVARPARTANGAPSAADGGDQGIGPILAIAI